MSLVESCRNFPSLFASQQTKLLFDVVFFNDLEALELVIRQSAEAVMFADNLILREACSQGKAEIVERLLQIPEICQPGYIVTALPRAAARGHLHIVERLLREHNADPDGEALLNAVKYGHTDIFQRLLAIPMANVLAQDGEVFVMSAAYEDTTMLNLLLNTHQDLIDDVLFGRMLNEAAASGSVQALDILLAMDLFELYMARSALEAASETGQVEIVQRLLQIPKIRSDVRAIELGLYAASLHNSVEVFQLLFVLPCVPPAHTASVALEDVAAHSDLRLLRFCLQVPGVDVSYADHVAMRQALHCHNLPALALLLQQPGADSGFCLQTCRVASLSEQEKTLLLRHLAQHDVRVGYWLCREEMPQFFAGLMAELV
eukprot:TRINITY_DN20498_c0_g2_i5.p1 TRINITY_DN20498_c0_g2~~TRINITY_DN20498_c0_g2_i5.p1  ORF type:complete len:375 (-),score=33.99 TRINITY_DN20498_c0_g2_i5:1377-2501(-)